MGILWSIQLWLSHCRAKLSKTFSKSRKRLHPICIPMNCALSSPREGTYPKGIPFLTYRKTEYHRPSGNATAPKHTNCLSQFPRRSLSFHALCSISTAMAGATSAPDSFAIMAPPMHRAIMMIFL